MARTPLLTSLQLLYRDLAGRGALRAFAGSFRRLRREVRHSPSRREFLQHSGALGAGAARRPCCWAARRGSGFQHRHRRRRHRRANAALALHDRGVSRGCSKPRNGWAGGPYRFTSWRTARPANGAASSGFRPQDDVRAGQRFRLTMLDRNKAAAKLAAPQATNWLFGQLLHRRRGGKGFPENSRRAGAAVHGGAFSHQIQRPYQDRQIWTICASGNGSNVCAGRLLRAVGPVAGHRL